VPDLDFRINDAEVLEFAAAPTMLFKLQIEERGGEAVRSLVLHAQIRIAAAQRHYSDEEQASLQEVFGELGRWQNTLKSLLWTYVVVLAPPFTGSTVVDVPVPCTYDFEVGSAKYLYALEDGEVPLEFLFSGTAFCMEGAGLQATQIPWEKEAHFRLPVRLWKQMMEHYFPNSAWLRLRKDVFNRLYSYEARHGLPTWKAALDTLLSPTEVDNQWTR
jgi:hypothetical protein